MAQAKCSMCQCFPRAVTTLPSTGLLGGRSRGGGKVRNSKERNRIKSMDDKEEKRET